MELEDLFDTSFKRIGDYKTNIKDISTINKVVEFTNIHSYIFQCLGNAVVLYDLLNDMPNLIVFKSNPLSILERVKINRIKRVKTPGFILTETDTEDGSRILAYVKDSFI